MKRRGAGVMKVGVGEGIKGGIGGEESRINRNQVFGKNGRVIVGILRSRKSCGRGVLAVGITIL